MRLRNLIVTTAVLAIAGGAFAGGAFAGDSRKQAVRLEKAKERMVAGAASVKPNQAARMRNEAADLQRMIDQLESGQKLEASEVDRAIKRSYKGF